MVKHSNLVYFILLILLGLSCKKHKSTEIIVEYPVFGFSALEVDLDTFPLDHFFVRESYKVPNTIDDELKKNGTNKASIKSAVLLSLKLQILDNVYADTSQVFDFKDLKEIYLDMKDDGVAQDLIAQKALVPDVRSNILSMDIVGGELKNYLQKESIQMVFKYRKRRQIHQQIPFTIVGKFKIIADPAK